MRIIAGRYKGRRLNGPLWEGTRPTSDQLRETLFNIISPKINGARVLDGFSGTGALGIEALSRGAEAITFIDDDLRAVQLIKKNLEACGVLDGYTILRNDVQVALNRMSADTLFDVMLFDPPYAVSGLDDVLQAGIHHLSPDGILIVEHSVKCVLKKSSNISIIREVRTGDSALSFLEAKTGEGKI